MNGSLLGVIASGYPYAPVVQTPLSHWPLDSIISSKTQDVVGSYDLDVFGGPSTTTGKFGGAINFNGSNQYLKSPDFMFDFDAAGGYSISFWFNSSVTPATSIGMLCSSLSPTESPYFYIGLRQATGKLILFDGRVFDITSGSALNDGSWHNIIYSYGFIPGNFDLYIDAVKVIDKESSVATSYMRKVSFAARVTSGTPNNYFTGLMDQCRVYSYGLSEAEALELFNE